MNLEAEQPVSVSESDPPPGCGIGVALSSYPSSYLLSLIVAKPEILFGSSGHVANYTNVQS